MPGGDGGSDRRRERMGIRFSCRSFQPAIIRTASPIAWGVSARVAVDAVVLVGAPF